MSDHLLRRTRSFVKRTAKSETVVGADGIQAQREYLQFANGEKFFFPIRIARLLSHDFAEDDPARLMEDVKALDDVRSGRGNVSGFVRIGLFRRLSSSGRSFILSLQRQRVRIELFVYAIGKGLPIPVGSFTDKQINVTDEDLEEGVADHGSLASRYEELERSLPARTKRINTGVFKPLLRRDLTRDNERITALLDRSGS